VIGQRGIAAAIVAVNSVAELTDIIGAARIVLTEEHRSVLASASGYESQATHVAYS
jgi:aryl-alcohol dehydrogenase-like predicted oxidoreductase